MVTETLVGVTEIDASVGVGVTVSVVVLIMESLVAVILDVPTANPVARPFELIVAAVLFELDQSTELVMS